MSPTHTSLEPISLYVGGTYPYGGDTVEAIAFAGTEVIVRLLSEGTQRSIPVLDLVSEIRRSTTNDSHELPDVPFSSHANLSDPHRAELSRRIEVLEWLISEQGRGRLLQELIPEACRRLDRKRRTVVNWLTRYRQGYDPIDQRWVSTQPSTTDPRWIAVARELLPPMIREPERTVDHFIDSVNDLYLERFSDDPEHHLPSDATAYRIAAKLGYKKSLFTGMTEAKRSIDDSRHGTGGKLIAAYPGEYVLFDTHTLDLWGRDPVTSRPITLQITTAIDLFSRSICALRVTAESTKSVDMAALLYEMVYGQAVPTSAPDEARFNYVGIPKNIVFTEDSEMWGMPSIIPTTLVTDHGKALFNAHTLAICRAFGIRIQPAQSRKPTDKAVKERFYRTLESELIQYLPGYKGRHVSKKGVDAEGNATYYPGEIDEIIRTYICSTYHKHAHEGLVDRHNPQISLSPNAMYSAGVNAVGLLRVPRREEDAYLFLEPRYRYINRSGVQIDSLVYNVPNDDPAFKDLREVRNSESGRYPGKYEFRVNPSDLRYIKFQRPDDGTWHTIPWEYARAMEFPLSRDISIEARTLATSRNKKERKRAIKTLMRSFEKDVPGNRKRRRIATQSYVGGPSSSSPDAVRSDLLDALDTSAVSRVLAVDVEHLPDDLDELVTEDWPYEASDPSDESYYDDAMAEQ